MTIDDRTNRRHISVRLQATLDELKELEKTTEDGGGPYDGPWAAASKGWIALFLRTTNATITLSPLEVD